MRKEYVEYMKELPISAYLTTIKEYPLHWQEALEIIFVLKGSITLKVESENYTVGERELEIINPNEVYAIEAAEEDNLVLFLQIDPSFFERYYDDAKEMFYYTNSTDYNAQEDERYYKLRELVAILVYEAASKLDDYEDQIDDKLLELMFHLLNNFHYLFYEEDSLREDEIQLERYHRIMKYLSNNYMNKVSLQELAEQEFLSTQYLSFKIKDVLGHSFNEYLNQIRVEESTKLLLDTDKSISEIAEDVGFSHLRYYNKHFKLKYKLTPIQYRKKYKVTEKELQKAKKIDYIELSDSLPYLEKYLFEYDRFHFDDSIRKLDIDLEHEVIRETKKPNTIHLGDVSLMLEEENRKVLREAQLEIGFDYCIVENLFSKNMDIYRQKSKRFINWTRVENILEFLVDLRLRPIIDSKGVENYVLEDFLYTFRPTYPKIDEWIDPSTNESELKFLDKEINSNNDKLLSAIYVVDSFMVKNENLTLKLIDEITEKTIIDNESFFGGGGIYTINYLNKPSFYAYKFLSLLGSDLIYEKDGVYVTKDGEDYQILIFNPNSISKAEFGAKEQLENRKERRFSLNLKNLDSDYQITKYSLDKSFGSVYDKWVYMGSPERLSIEGWTLLDNYVHPKVNFYYGKKSSVFNLLTRVKQEGVVLFTLNKIQQ